MRSFFKNNLYIFTLLFFLLGLFNMLFAWLGTICMVLPFVLLKRDQKKTWCHKHCPRADLFTTLLKNNPLGKRPIPQWIRSEKTKTFFLRFFLLNIFFMTMSTFGVLSSRIAPMEYLRFFIAFRVPFTIPQMVELSAAPWLLHLSYRFFSMFFTTTFVGLIMGLFYQPRTWCVVCPVSTLSDIYLEKQKDKVQQKWLTD